MSTSPKLVMETELNTITVPREKITSEARPYILMAFSTRITPTMELRPQPAAITIASLISFIPIIKYCTEDIDEENRTMKQLVAAVVCPFSDTKFQAERSSKHRFRG